ncbi:Nicotinamide-nucleotide amidohydrolase PncC [compost metagenome]
MFEADLLADAERLVAYLHQAQLRLITAESCTGGHISALLAAVPNSGEVMEGGLVVYSPDAKRQLLGVDDVWLQNFNLTSVEVAAAMAAAALRYQPANAALATTGLLGTEAKDGIAPGTVCLAWGFRTPDGPALFTRMARFHGTPEQMRNDTVRHALGALPEIHRLVCRLS